MNSTSSSFSGPASPGDTQSRSAIWTGRALSAVVVVLMLADGLVQLLVPTLLEADMEAIGFPAALSPTLGLITLICVLLYAVPRTAIIGAALLTGFLGGAIAMHFRIGEIGSVPQLISLGLGVMAWGGLYLRDSRIRLLLA